MTDLLKQLAFASRDDLIAALQYSLAENDVLREAYEGQVPVTKEDRWKLQRFARDVPKTLDGIITIRKPRTVRNWDKPRKWKRRVGRPMTREALRALIIRLAEENEGWGARKIFGELRKLGFGRRVSEPTIRRILRAHGIPPDRSKMVGWHNFKARHPGRIWSCDFLTVPVHTPRGRKDAYVLAFIHWETRRAFFSSATFHPTQDWTGQQGRNWLMEAEDLGLEGSALVLDRDDKFGTILRNLVESCSMEFWRTPIRVPQCNGFAESLVGTTKRECLNGLIFNSLEDVTRAVDGFSVYYNTHRPHQGLGNVTLGGNAPVAAPERFSVEDIEVQTFADGMLRSYRWAPGVAA
jgi:putative transposase